MPELPEVETIRRDLAVHLTGKKITSVNILSAKTALPDAAFFKDAAKSRKITKIERRGKLLIIALAPQRLKPGYLLIHLKMTGQLIYIDKRTKIAGGHSLGPETGLTSSGLSAAVGGELPNKQTRAILTLSGGGTLFFNDIRKFGYLKAVTKDELTKIIENSYGPEPLTPDFSVAYLTRILAGKKTNIKAALLDQKLIAGLGNIYVDESLYAARIKPLRLAGSLRLTEIKKLRQEINRIIKLAISQRGTTFSNYVDSQGRHGNFSELLKVYGRGGKQCLNCKRPLIKIKVAGRGTHYCSHCQK